MIEEMFLRGPIVEALDRLVDDVSVERYGDPHVGFAVFLSPDGPPKVAVLSDLGLHDLGHVRMKLRQEADSSNGSSAGRFFTVADLEEAAHALMDAYSGARERRWRPERTEPLSADIEGMWHRRREAALDRQVRETAERLRRAAQCPHCGGRYTEKGLRMHLARSVYCSRREAEAMSAAEGKGEVL